MSPFRFRLLQVLRQRKPQRGDRGFSLVLAVVTLLTLLMGGLILANRSSQSVLGLGFLQQTWDARNAAEIGMTRIISELNKPQNRMLMTKKATAADADFLWTGTDITNSKSNCPGSIYQSPDISSSQSIGYTSTAPYAEVYLDSAGNVLSSSQGAIRSYRLIRVERATKSELAQFTEKTFALVVEGKSYRNGGIVATSRIEKSFSLVPKCCNASFGGTFGNDNYSLNINDITANSCYDKRMLGLGLLAGHSDSSNGSITLNGTSNDIENSTGEPITKIYCVAGTNGTCTINESDPNVNIEVVDFQMPPAPSFPGTQSAALVERPSANPTRNAHPNNPPLTYCVSDSDYDPLLDSETDSFVDTNGKRKTCRRWIISAMATSDIPNCTRTTKTITRANGTTETFNELHCNISKLSYRNSEVIFLTSPTDRLRLYFTQPSANSSDLVINGLGSGLLNHCSGYNINRNECTKPASSTDLALFGCNNCGTQNVELRGNSAGLSLFSYFPKGNFQLSGTPDYEGLLWSNQITAQGNATLTVPRSGAAEAFLLIKLLNEGVAAVSNNNYIAFNPLIFDVVARATSAFRWLSGN